MTDNEAIIAKLQAVDELLKLMGSTNAYLRVLVEQTKKRREAALALKKCLEQNLIAIKERITSTKAQYDLLKEQFEHSQRCEKLHPCLTRGEMDTHPPIQI